MISHVTAQDASAAQFVLLIVNATMLHWTLTRRLKICWDLVMRISGMYIIRVDPTYFFQESILTKDLYDTPTFEVP